MCGTSRTTGRRTWSTCTCATSARSSTGRSNGTGSRPCAGPATGCAPTAAERVPARSLSLHVRLTILLAVGTSAVLAVAASALCFDVRAEANKAITAELRVRAADLATTLGREPVTRVEGVVGQV